MTDKVLDIVLDTIERHTMLSPSDHIIIGLSGGADSVALLGLLLELREKYTLTLSAVHVNHGLRGDEADEDERFCVGLCKKYNIPIELYKYDVGKISSARNITEEEAGREARYAAFYDAKGKLNAQKIAVAHNQNDQAETIFLRLFRGAGLRGLAGIPPVRDCIIRPLIDVRRDKIEEYCSENNLRYRNDHTNYMDIYSRNLVRSKVIPLVEKHFNPAVVRTLSQTAKILRLENDYLDLLAKEAYAKSVTDNGESLNINILSGFDDVIKMRVIRIAYLKLNDSLEDMEYNHVEKVLSLLNMQSGKKIIISNGIVAKKQYNRLVLKYNKKEKLEFSYVLKPNEDIYIKEAGLWATVSKTELKNIISRNNVYTKRIYCDKIKCDIKLRTRLPGDKINILNVGTKKLKDYLIDKKIETDKRNMLFYLADGENILGIVGVGVPDNTESRETDESRENFYVQLWEDKK